MTTDIVCVFWGNKFSVDYVYNLKSAVERNTSKDYRFVCLSDRLIPGIETRFLRPGIHGWWNKLQMFDSSLDLQNRVVYFDLDTLITGNIDWLIEYDGNFMGIEDVGAVNPHQPHLKNVLQTGVMAFKRSSYWSVFNEFVFSSENIVNSYRGDGEFLQQLIKKRDLLQHLFPGKLKSYKYQVYPNRPDDETAVVCFHGRPSIIQAMEETVVTPRAKYDPVEWIRDYWG